MKNNQYPKELISEAEIMKIVCMMIMELEKQNTIHLNTKIQIKNTKSGEKEEKAKEEEYQESFSQKVNWEKAHAISVEILDIFFQTSPNQNHFQKINGHSKQQYNIYFLSHISLNHNTEKKAQPTKYEEKICHQ